jgi:hypothetical protein
MYNKYYLEYKYLPLHERENLSHMATEYFALNGNGVVPPLIEKMYGLPTEPPDEEDKSK